MKINRKALVSLLLAAVMLFSASLAFAATVEPNDKEMKLLAGKTVHATVGEYSEETKTFRVTVYDYDRYDKGDVEKLAVGDTILAGGELHQITAIRDLDGTKLFICDGDEEIYFGDAYDGSENPIARSTMDDRAFMNVVTVLYVPAAEGLVYEDNSDPDLDAGPVVTEGLENILKIKAEKERDSIGFDSYATTVTLNENLEITKIHQDFDVAQ